MILDEIVAHKKTEVDALKKSGKAARWIKNIRKLPPLRDFRAALAAPGFHVIAEIKRASPSSGGIRPDLNPMEMAGLYTKGGASVISVLTDKKYFSGHISDLQIVRDTVAVPLLRKDFTLDSEQIIEARVGGADTVLLIVAILSPEKLTELINFARSLGMEPLVEVHSEAEMGVALRSSARIIGINNRDLQTFKVDISTTEKIMAKLSDADKKDRIFIAESGVSSADHIKRMAGAGVKAVLVGESLIRSGNPAETISEWLAAARGQ